MLAPMAEKYERILRSQGRSIARELRAQSESLTAAFVPPNEDEVLSPEKIAEQVTGLTEIERMGVAVRLEESLANQGISWDIGGDYPADILLRHGLRQSLAVERELRLIYRETLVQAGDRGWSIPTTARAIIENVDTVAPARATALARTDLIGLSNGTSSRVANQAFAEREDVTKIWLSTDDDRTRDTHVEANGQEVPLKEPFFVGGVPLNYPGDPFGPDEEVINCRCTILYSKLKPPEVKKFDLDTLEPELQLRSDAAFTWETRGQVQADALGMSLSDYRFAVEEKLKTDLATAPVKIRRSSDTALRIARSIDGRFKSQFETDRSSGLYDPDIRARREAEMYGYPKDLPPPERPIYGYLGGVTDEAGAVNGYGPVTFVLKKDVRARTTFTSEDSLSAGLVPSPVNQPNSLSLKLPYSLGDYRNERIFGLSDDIRTWDTYYWEAQVHGGVSLDDVEKIEIWYGDPTELKLAKDTAAKLKTALGAAGRSITIELRAEPPVDVRGLGSAGFADDRVGVEASGGLLPAAPSKSAVHGNLVEETVALRVVDPDDGILVGDSATDEEHVGVPTLNGDNAHGSHDTTGSVRRALYAARIMPWHVVENHSECNATRPFAVVRDAGGVVEGCHATRESANRQMSALYAQEENKAVTASTITVTVTDGDPAESERVPWEGVLAVAGKATSDRRYLIPGEIGHRDLPLPLAGSHEDQHATETVGRIETIEHIPAADFVQDGWELPGDLPPQAVVIWGTGTFDGSDAAADALRALENGVGVSLDLPMERQALIDATTYEEIDPSTLTGEDFLGIAFGAIPDGYLHGIAGKIGGLSLASIAAFEETTIRVVEQTAVVASGYSIRERDGQELREMDLPSQLVMLASAAPLEPPRDWFFMEEPDEPTPITITKDGRISGHLALWNTCHSGRSNGAYSTCMYAPHSPSGYKQFHLGSMLCDDGAEIAIGRVTVGTGHAPLHLGAAAARRHYDNTGACAAYVRASDGVFGIWLCGAVRSDASAEMVRDLRACPPSGDWRSVDRALELQAALAVNVPGYVVPRSQLALAASADMLEIATLILGAPEEADYIEALKVEHAQVEEEDLTLLVELSIGEFCGTELAALGHVDFKTYSEEQRRAMAAKGQALPDGSFPIADCGDAQNAIRAQGRGGASQRRIVSHISKRVRALGCTGSVFDPYK